MTNVLRVFSFGGGVQSTAVLALQALGRLERPYDAFVFADVGADSENPDTIAYVRDVVIPFAEAHGIRFEVIHKMRKGEQDTVYQSVMRDNRSVPIPAILPSGAFGNRTCTVDFKIRVVDAWVKRAGFTHYDVGLGISTDEYQRARFDDDYIEQQRPAGLWKRREYPLIDMRMTRADCYAAILEAGLPKPPKSACFFCPFQSSARWIEMRRDRPDLFEKAVALDRQIRDKRASLDRDEMYLHKSRQPLEIAVGEQPLLFGIDDDDSCDSGYCMT